MINIPGFFKCGFPVSKNEIGKYIYAELLRNMVVRSSSYVTIPLRYGGLGMELHLSLALQKILPAPVFSCV
jgi:hypothetical protein